MLFLKTKKQFKIIFILALEISQKFQRLHKNLNKYIFSFEPTYSLSSFSFVFINFPSFPSFISKTIKTDNFFILCFRELNFTGSKLVVKTQTNEVSLTNLKVSSWKTGDSRERTKTYGFDFCFDSSNPDSENYATQAKIYETLGESVLNSLFSGYNACLVAYGQSASGKTYTMMGTKVMYYIKY